MTICRQWLLDASGRYEACNRAALSWLLARPPLDGVWLDTKVNSRTGESYGRGSGLRGPDYIYGWIQGRGLEALATFAAHYRGKDDALADRLLARMWPLYAKLAALQAQGGHCYFCYGPAMQPLTISAPGDLLPQNLPGDVFTYSDAFVAKGLIAAAATCQPDALTGHLAYLRDIISAIRDGRFQMDEKALLSQEAARAQPQDFGPRMILLGAAGLLHRLGLPEETGFAGRFITHILSEHMDCETGLLFCVPGQEARNLGHAIEFAGFALEHLHNVADAAASRSVIECLALSLEAGLSEGPGIPLSWSPVNTAPLSPYYPWWPLPEAMRAAALGLVAGGPEALLSYWQAADRAFFTCYWQPEHGFAHQTLTEQGAVDFVPATPDLDPAYHTALSFLTASKGAAQLARIYEVGNGIG